MKGTRGLEVALRVAHIEGAKKLRALADARSELSRISERVDTLARHGDAAARVCAPVAGQLHSAASLVQAHESRLAVHRLRLAEEDRMAVSRLAEAKALEALAQTRARARAYANALERRKREQRRSKARRAAQRLDEQNLGAPNEEGHDDARSA